jgi:hypothetical protein
MPVERELVPELLLEHVPDHPFRLRAEDVERIRVDGCIRAPLQCEQADLRVFAVRDNELVLECDGSERLARKACVRTLVLGSQRLAPPQEGVASESDDDARQLPSVATMTALIVCIR